MLAYTRSVVYLDEGNLAVVRPGGYQVKDRHAVPLEQGGQPDRLGPRDHRAGRLPALHAEGDLRAAGEPPQHPARPICSRRRARPGSAGLNLTDEDLPSVDRIVLTACGTSWHAALVGEYMLEELARLPVEVEYASEFRYRNPLVDERTLVIVISQSGETADTLAALREAKRRGARTLGIVNVVGCTIAREADGGIYIHAGPEIGVASTKAFTSQIAALALFALHLGRLRSLSILQGREIVKALHELPGQLEAVLDKRPLIEELAERYARRVERPVPGPRLQLPGRARRRAQAQGDLLHPRRGLPRGGDEARPHRADRRADAGRVRRAARRGAREDRVEHRGGAGARRPDHRRHHRGRHRDHLAGGPRDPDSRTLDMLTPILTSVPLQLLAYHIAVRRGCNVDQPRNLAKSVTVE